MARGPSINSNKCSKCHLNGHNIRSCLGEQVEESSMHAEMPHMQAGESNMQAEMQHMEVGESNVQAEMAYMQAEESNMQVEMPSILPEVQGSHEIFPGREVLQVRKEGVSNMDLTEIPLVAISKAICNCTKEAK
ncbi:hypothetical protein ACH5RR_034541 [Cinchona calisaya]|uniref:Uncharacterized protein n=1 Tax=Cinchona calisaya TaxID=153742 RepID=A0ABD2YFS1_9GENT